MLKIGDLFYINRHDRRILLVLLTVAAIALGGMFLLGGNEEAETSGESETSGLSEYFGNTGDSTSTGRTGKSAHPRASVPATSDSYYAQPTRSIECFPFDPNTADSTQLLRLGLQPWQVRNIYKYRAAGGVYHRKEDFARLYGLTAKQYQELEPYIRISPDFQQASAMIADEKPVMRDTLRFPVKIKENETIDLNANDTSIYKKVPGIGSFFSRKIADYGRRLGGYVSIDQLDEIEGFPQTSKRYFSLATADVKPLNINRLSLQELKHHPYINYYQARAIVDYRRQHGLLHSLQELSLLPEFSDEAIHRLEPYVCYE